jgi:hypothetical protein
MFSHCKSLSAIVFESNSKLKKIGGQAFCHSEIKTIGIPGSVEKIGKYCFCGCGSFSKITFEGSPSL